jgi:hypothetical protein
MRQNWPIMRFAGLCTFAVSALASPAGAQMQQYFAPIASTPAYVQQQQQQQIQQIQQQQFQQQFQQQQQQQQQFMQQSQQQADQLRMQVERGAAAPRAGQSTWSIPPNVTCNFVEQLTTVCYFKSVAGWHRLRQEQLKTHAEALAKYRATIQDPKELALFDADPAGYIAAQEQRTAASANTNGGWPPAIYSGAH